jgi:Na+-transporting NADH:ubiquinone oxidoreductase subunit NqrD
MLALYIYIKGYLLIISGKKRKRKKEGVRELADSPLLILFISAPSIFFIFCFFIWKGPKVIKDKRKL